jgi:hypothetical protein
LGPSVIDLATVDRDTAIVHHHLRPLPGELQGVTSSDPSACTGDDHHPTIREPAHDPAPLMTQPRS